MLNCECNMCKARENNCSTLEIYYGDKLEAELVKINPNYPVYVYEDYVRTIKEGLYAKEEVIQLFKNKQTYYDR